MTVPNRKIKQKCNIHANGKALTQEYKFSYLENTMTAVGNCTVELKSKNEKFKSTKQILTK